MYSGLMASYRATSYGPTPAVFISKNDGTLWMVDKVNRYDPNSDWTPWRKVSVPVGGMTVGSVFPRAGGLLQAFFIANSDSSVRTMWEILMHRWSEWQLFWDGAGVTSVAAVALPDGRLQVFVTLRTNTIFTTWKKTTAENSDWVPWREFTPPGRHRIRRISACILADGRIQLFVTTGLNVLTTWKVHRHANSDWAPWRVWYDTREDDKISAGNLPDGRVQLWRLKIDGHLSSRWKTGGPNSDWSPWRSFHAPGRPVAFTVAPLNDGRLQVWVADQSGDIHTQWKVSTDPNAAWTPWKRFHKP
ncbi:hypothetical protein ABH14_22705 [Brevibacillus brevis]|uniref:hypothetical protein n=1 Tax=Brevibacillus brevis TaxID=1393 RepID=UPI0019004174|nr:hypothetical protein [Brevibacillus brevis]MBH0332535.1 hypothetical protein [Brevibacillus brevis]